jgi:hypothetical protein
VIALPLLAGCGGSSQPAGGEVVAAPELKARLKELRVEQLKSARAAQDAVRASYNVGSIQLDAMFPVMEAVWKAELAVATTPQERIEAHRHYIGYLRQLDEQMSLKFDLGAPSVQAAERYLTVYERQNAEIALVEECLASGLPLPTAFPTAGIIIDGPDDGEEGPAK